jgi:hypothetical protein
LASLAGLTTPPAAAGGGVPGGYASIPGGFTAAAAQQQGMYVSAAAGGAHGPAPPPPLGMPGAPSSCGTSHVAAADIVTLLIGVFESQDVFVNEFRWVGGWVGGGWCCAVMGKHWVTEMGQSLHRCRHPSVVQPSTLHRLCCHPCDGVVPFLVVWLTICYAGRS